ncbi:MAG: MBL fold metallo-hydrolase [Clostridia bacterium]|nr:MBL fold metallo-hydrolase [Clostridia bacterium]
MLGDMTPFKIAGNLYFVGEHRASSHMIDTGDGLILIDVGYEETADIVIESLETLGFDVKDVKYILLSHGHSDHSHGAPKIVERSGAKVFMFEEDNRYLNGFLPDIYFRDGDVIRLGNTAITVLHTPGHTAGTASFFFDVEDDGRTVRAGMFGGAGIKQVMKPWLDEYGLPYDQRRQFFESIERLRGEHVDLFIGNHAGQNRTREKYEKMKTAETNPFIDETAWGRFLDKTEKTLEEKLRKESHTEFVNYAHRGASEYLPENTLLAFYTGLYMNANGIETDVRRAKDGTLVLFHDKTLERATGEAGLVEDYTFEELQAFTVKKDGYEDRIVAFEDFLKHFAFRDITFAIELKGKGVEEDVAELLRKYKMEKKAVVTSFHLSYLRAFKAYAPEFRVGYLAKEITPEVIAALKEIGADEICPRASLITPDLCDRLHRLGFRVRAWGLTRDLLETVYDSYADGTTANFPDLLDGYIRLSNAEAPTV